MLQGQRARRTDLFAGRIRLMVDAITTGLVNSRGSVRALVGTTPKRTLVAPDIPAIAEFPPGFAMAGWHWILAPRGTPASVVALLNWQSSRLKAPDLRERFLAMGAEPAACSRPEFVAFIKGETAKWMQLMHGAGIKSE